MLTDDDLARELRAAFRAETDAMSYDGRRRPRPASAYLLPLAAAAIVGVAVAGAVGLSGHQSRPAADSTPAPTSPAPTLSASPAMVTETLSLAGYTVRVRHPVGEKFSVRGSFRDEVPAGLEVVILADGTKASVGKDPVTGDNAVFLGVHGRGHGAFVILSQADVSLISGLVEGSPTPIPLTTD